MISDSIAEQEQEQEQEREQEQEEDPERGASTAASISRCVPLRWGPLGERYEPAAFKAFRCWDGRGVSMTTAVRLAGGGRGVVTDAVEGPRVDVLIV